MAQKITVTLEDDLDGGPANETLQFSVGGTTTRSISTRRTPVRSASKWHPSLSMPAGLGEDGAINRGVLSQAGTVVMFARGRKTRASRSANVGASRPASLNSTKPPPKDPDNLIPTRFWCSRSGAGPAPRRCTQTRPAGGTWRSPARLAGVVQQRHLHEQ